MNHIARTTTRGSTRNVEKPLILAALRETQLQTLMDVFIVQTPATITQSRTENCWFRWKMAKQGKKQSSQPWWSARASQNEKRAAQAEREQRQSLTPGVLPRGYSKRASNSVKPAATSERINFRA